MCKVVKGVFVVAAKRTPFGSFGGKLMNMTITDLQEVAFKAALTAGNIKPEWIDSVIVGNVYPVSDVLLNIPYRITSCFQCIHRVNVL